MTVAVLRIMYGRRLRLRLRLHRLGRLPQDGNEPGAPNITVPRGTVRGFAGWRSWFCVAVLVSGVGRLLFAAQAGRCTKHYRCVRRTFAALPLYPAQQQCGKRAASQPSLSGGGLVASCKHFHQQWFLGKPQLLRIPDEEARGRANEARPWPRRWGRPRIQQRGQLAGEREKALSRAGGEKGGRKLKKHPRPPSTERGNRPADLLACHRVSTSGARSAGTGAGARSRSGKGGRELDDKAGLGRVRPGRGVLVVARPARQVAS